MTRKEVFEALEGMNYELILDEDGYIRVLIEVEEDEESNDAND